jgi:hypothetical protein
MKKSTELTYADVSLGDEFLFSTSEYDFSANPTTCKHVIKVGVVTDHRTTKAGRVKIAVNAHHWMNGPAAPTTLIQDHWWDDADSSSVGVE